tara:strand:- start:1363 stop:1500 length:138 start_codon:yes stop_codon:yes gene_type:complete
MKVAFLIWGVISENRCELGINLRNYFKFTKIYKKERKIEKGFTKY